MRKKSEGNPMIVHKRQVENVRNDGNRTGQKVKNEKLADAVENKASRRDKIENDYMPFSCSSCAFIDITA